MKNDLRDKVLKFTKNNDRFQRQEIIYFFIMNKKLGGAIHYGHWKNHWTMKNSFASLAPVLVN